MTRLIAFEIDCEEKTCGKCASLATLQDMQEPTWCDRFRHVLDAPGVRCKYCLEAEKKLPEITAAQILELQDYGQTVTRLRRELALAYERLDELEYCHDSEHTRSTDPAEI